MPPARDELVDPPFASPPTRDGRGNASESPIEGGSWWSLGAALGVHCAIGLAAFEGPASCPHATAPAVSELVFVEALDLRAAPAPETVPASPHIIPSPARPRAAPPASAPNPSTPPSAAPPSPPVPVVLTAPASSFSVDSASGDGPGTSNATVAPTSPEGAAMGAAIVADPRPSRLAYRAAIASRIGRPDYTSSMRRRGLEGRVSIGLLVDATGRVLTIRVRGSSGNDELDENAVTHVRGFVAALGRLDPPPAESAWGTRELALTFAYELDDE